LQNTLGLDKTTRYSESVDFVWRLEDSQMAWKWPGSSTNGSSEEWTGFIDQGVTLEGTLQLTGTFRIDGNVKGNIISEQTLILGENAKVEGQIEGNRVVIAGRYDGVIFAKGRVEIQPKGVVTGEVHSPCLVIDPGGIFDGRCHMLAASDTATAPSVTIPIRALSQA
jgi:cytoskeletal protein CcmA (bactofilin family)